MKRILLIVGLILFMSAFANAQTLVSPIPIRVHLETQRETKASDALTKSLRKVKDIRLVEEDEDVLVSFVAYEQIINDKPSGTWALSVLFGTRSEKKPKYYLYYHNLITGIREDGLEHIADDIVNELTTRVLDPVRADLARHSFK